MDGRHALASNTDLVFIDILLVNVWFTTALARSRRAKGCHKGRKLTTFFPRRSGGKEIRVQKARASFEGPPRTMPSSSSMGITDEVSAEALTRLPDALRTPGILERSRSRIVSAVLGGHDVLAVMPTGSGKSLTYQLPSDRCCLARRSWYRRSSRVDEGSVDELNRRGIRSGALHSMLTTDGR